MSGTHRKQSLPPQLASAVAAADEAQLRVMIGVGCRLAVARTGVARPGVDAGLAALVADRLGDRVERRALRRSVERAVEELDHAAYALRGDDDEEEESAALRAAFERARAAAAVALALDVDPRRAAEAALYEASAAVDAAELQAAVLAARSTA